MGSPAKGIQFQEATDKAKETSGTGTPVQGNRQGRTGSRRRKKQYVSEMILAHTSMYRIDAVSLTLALCWVLLIGTLFLLNGKGM